MKKIAHNAKMLSRPFTDSDVPVAMLIAGHEEPMPLTITGHEEVARAVGIPVDYYQRMLTHAPDLLAANVNTWLQAGNFSIRCSISGGLIVGATQSRAAPSRSAASAKGPAPTVKG